MRRAVLQLRGVSTFGDDRSLRCASIDVEEGDYLAAREKLERSFQIKQAIGDRAGVAATWHQLASIDVEEGAYVAAREKLDRALAMRQTIGDRAGEAATFYQLGSLAGRMNRFHQAARLTALCYLIDWAIGHGNTESDFKALSVICQALDYDQAQFDAVLAEAQRAYDSDRGRALVERTFADEQDTGH